MLRTLVLDSGEQPHRIVSWYRAVSMLLCPRCGKLSCQAHPTASKAEVLRQYEATVHSEWERVLVPAVVKIRRTVPYVQREVRFNRINLFLRDRFTCGYDGQVYPIGQLTIDHVVPRAHWKGPPEELTTWTNAVTACRRCNLRKGARTPKQAGMKLLHKPVRPTTLPPLPFLVPDRVAEEWLDYLPEHRRAA